MNRTPSSRPSPPVGEKVPGGRLRGIPTGSWLQLTSYFGRCSLSMNHSSPQPPSPLRGERGGVRGELSSSFSNSSSRGPGAEPRRVDARPTENENCHDYQRLRGAAN